MELYGNVDSKFRYVIVAAKRAKQLIKGSKPKITLKSRNPIRLAQAEVRAGLVDYHILQNTAEDVVDDSSLIHAGDVDEADDSGSLLADEGDLAGDDALVEADEEGAELNEDIAEAELGREKNEQ